MLFYRIKPLLFNFLIDREAQEKGEPTALGLSKLMKTFKFVATLSLMNDVLTHLARLSKLFQRRDVNLAHIEPLLTSSTVQTLQKMETHLRWPDFQRLDELIRTSLRPFTIAVAEDAKRNLKENIKLKFLRSSCPTCRIDFLTVKSLQPSQFLTQ